MRSRVCFLAFATLACCYITPSSAQQSPPATLEELLNSDNAQQPAVPTEAGVNEAVPKRPAGTVVRPQGGVQHPDLDKAWAVYDAEVERAADAIRAAITEQFNTAAAEADLDAAQKWQAALGKFEKAGEVPTEREIEVAVSEAVAVYRKARAELIKAYGPVVTALTIEKKIAEATAAREESQNLAHKAATGPVSVLIEAGSYKSAVPRKNPDRDAVDRASPQWDNLTVPADSTLTWDVDVPRKGDFFIHVLYAGSARPCDVSVNGKIVARNVFGGNTGGFMKRNLKWETLGPVAFEQRNELAIDPKTHGPHLSQIVISSDRETPDSKPLAARLSKHRYRKVIISPSGQRQELNEVFTFTEQGDVLVNGKPSLRWQPFGQDGVRIDIGAPNGFVELRVGPDSSLRGQNKGRTDRAVWGWELLP